MRATSASSNLHFHCSPLLMRSTWGLIILVNQCRFVSTPPLINGDFVLKFFHHGHIPFLIVFIHIQISNSRCQLCGKKSLQHPIKTKLYNNSWEFSIWLFSLFDFFLLFFLVLTWLSISSSVHGVNYWMSLKSETVSGTFCYFHYF